MPAREDLFTPVHKALRAMMYDLSSRVQSNDFADLAATRALVVDLEHDFAVARSAGCMLCVFHEHADTEEGIVFPEVKRTSGELVASLIAEHLDLARREIAITDAAHALLALGSEEDRLTAGTALNLALNQLLAAYLVHINREDAELVPRMREHFTDPQMAKMRGAIIAQFPPDRLFALLGWMLPALNVTELTDLIGELKRSAPPPVTQAVVDLAAAKVPSARWTEVRVRVGL
ncbi:MAG TPA: hemerythrin domain-containing protein [Thermoplasmata archaeon]|nr:hemerythrin domain-containing protein [Thermoplasmata archaeon]